MTLHKLSAGDGYTYLTRQVAAMDSTEKGYSALGDYYSQRGESPGRWAGAGLTGLGRIAPGQEVTETQMKALFGEGRHPDASTIERETFEAGASPAQALKTAALGKAFPIYETATNGFRARCAEEFSEYNAALGVPRDWPVPSADRARIRSRVGREMFAETHDRPPADARELAGFIARAGRPATTAVAGYDLTFSPVKSVSALWALAPREVSEQIEAAHHAAVADSLAWLEKEASYTRTGAAGVRQVEVTGLIAATFTHRDSRAGDPDLHTHVAVSNKVQSRDGKWLALDGRILHKATVSASERYNTRLEAELVGRLGIAFANRPSTDIRKRPVREIVGVDAALLTAWSSRRTAINTRRGELAAQFQYDYGRPPTPIEAIQLAQQATLETRGDKHEPRSLGQQRAEWRREAIGVIGGPPGITRMLDRVLNGAPTPLRRITPDWVQDASAQVLRTVSAERATWQVWHVTAEAERQVRAFGIAPDQVETAVSLLVSEVLNPQRSLPLGNPERISEPAVLRRSDGASVYSVAGSQLYTSQAVLEAERLLVDAAGRTDGRSIEDASVELALLESAANGVELNPGQAQMVRELATTAAPLRLAIAPAGSGKTTAMRVLARAWTDSGGNVLGLGPTAVAAIGLRDQIEAHSDTLAKLIWSVDIDAAKTGRLSDPATVDRAALPEWVRRIGPDTLVIIDEAGMAGTVDLAQTVQFVLAQGGAVRLIGDDQQLTAIAAGGVLRDIAEVHGVITLSELHRFTDPAEGAATLALRGGDVAGLGFYLDRGRVHVGDETTVADHAYQGWAADRAAGKDAVMLAPTRELTSQLNARARADRHTTEGNTPGREVDLADGNRASAGDSLITRQNDRRLPITRTDWVKNGDRWTVAKVHRSGALDVIHRDTRRRITLPAAYVARDAELGYASTVHGAQGITADACHTVATGAESRQLLYVAMTRGRHSNHVYLATAGDGDPHSVITPDAIRPPTATDILTGILGRDQAQRSATTIGRELIDPALRLHEATARYQDALGLAAETELGADGLAVLALAADQLHDGLTEAPAWPTLRAQLALLAVDGNDPIRVLRDAAAGRELDSAEDPAAVLDWRLDPSGGLRAGGPLPWLPAIPPTLADNPNWGRYLSARAELVADCAGTVRDRTAVMTPTTAPPWATRLLDPDEARLRADLAVWRAATGTATHDRRPTGPPQRPAAALRHQHRLDERAEAAMGQLNRAGTQWAALADSIDLRLSRDDYWPELADRLAAADRAGIDIAGMLSAVAAERSLPDDMPAAALWWRLSAHLAPAAVTATAGSGAATLRPAWTATLLNQLPPGRAQRVLADPSWPALVAAINTGTRKGWNPADLITAATAGLGEDGDPRLPAEDLTGALVFRVAMLTDPAPVDVDEQMLPPDPAEDELSAPDDVHLLPPPPEPDAGAGPVSGAGDEPPFDDDDPGPWDPGESAALPEGWSSWLGLAPEPDPFDYVVEEHFRTVVAPRLARLCELNQQAAEFFTDRYPQSWAADYLRERLGGDLVADDRFNPGYAPAGWTNLVEHLRRNGANDEEIVAAGLGVYASTGRVIDRFRDRLIFPIHGTDGEIHGFIGRRNPDHDEAGPKYLNTASNDLFSKGDQLFGIHEGRGELATGATPVLVEGPVDAWAVTLAGQGASVGVAALGTAFTDRQADQLRPYIGADRPGIIVATDADAGGQKAAERAYWQLTARGDDPRRLTMPAEVDPAKLLELGGPEALWQALAESGSLAAHLIDARITAATGTSRTSEEQAIVVREAAEIISALPPPKWLEHIERVTADLDAAPGSVHLEVIEAGTAWVLDPSGRRVGDITSDPRARATAGTRDRLGLSTTPEVSEAALTQHWEQLSSSIDPRLLSGADWGLLAGAISRAHAGGYDVATNLPILAAAAPLPEQKPARELYWRLLNHCKAAVPLPPQRTTTPVLVPEHARHPDEPPSLGGDRDRPSGPSR